MKRAILILLCLLAGVGLLVYPYVSNYLTQLNGSTAIQEYDDQITAEVDAEALAAARALAEEYNASLTGQGITDPFIPGSGVVLPDNYAEILDFTNHMMGYIEIPKIDVYLPVYHGVTEDVLAKGVGHMSETAFPIGGEGNHSVLTGHTGLSTAKLFTDLVELKEGDTFYIHILGGTLAYVVDQIKIVEPDVTEDLLPTPGKDYVTLITCTPYAVNSHRLLVRGIRTEYVQEVHEAERHVNRSVVNGVDKRAIIYGAGAAALILIVIVILLIRSGRKPKRSDIRPASAAPKHAKGRR